WQKMSRAGGGAPPEFMSTHPSSSSRIAALQAAIPKVMPLYEQARKYRQRHPRVPLSFQGRAFSAQGRVCRPSWARKLSMSNMVQISRMSPFGAKVQKAMAEMLSTLSLGG